MAGKFVELKDAATMIGVTPEELVEMRSNGEIFGYRDGASWKFKLEEVQRVVRERAASGSRISDSAVLSANDEEFENLITGLSSKILAEKAQEESETGSVLVSEEELGVSSTGQSTIIGKQKPDAAADSDLRLAEDSGKDPAGGSDKLLEAPGSKLDVASASDVLHGSDLKIKGESSGGTGDMPAPTAGSTGSALGLGENLSLGDDDDLELGSDSALDDEIKPQKKESSIGSDVTLGSGDSGINLSPADSGISLEDEPLELGGSGVESLELPEDEEIVALETEGADPDQATQLKADNEFLLSPGDTLTEDESDSGSQVIALEDSESFDQEAATMLKAEPAGLAPDAFTPVVADTGLAAAPGMMPTQPTYVQVPVVEQPYSVWNVISLSLAVLLLAMAGMLMVDVMLNMWSFSEPGTVSTGIMDMFLATFGMG
jgi:hypothetical protein